MDTRQREIESLEEFDAALNRMAQTTLPAAQDSPELPGLGVRPRLDQFDLEGWLVRDVDLTGRTETLRALNPSGMAFLGCTFAPGAEDDVRARGGLVFPELPDLPFNPYRSQLYTAEELYCTPAVSSTGVPNGAYETSSDAQIYAWGLYHLHRSPADSLAVALHDHAISNGLDDALPEPRTLVGVMGGHSIDRGTLDYENAARLGAALARSGRTVVTGGGPGAMEAANLGARLADYSDADIGLAAQMLADVPSYRPSIDAWARAGFDVLERFPSHRATFGIPTWFYGHEPPNVFPTRIAKYFRNAIREDILLARCRGGIVCLPGRAGTVQEIFQATTSNFYAATPEDLTPMVLVGQEYWTRTLPAWQLLRALAGNRMMSQVIHLVDSVEEAAEVVSSPVRAPGSV